jgi:hypothetical protein
MNFNRQSFFESINLSNSFIFVKYIIKLIVVYLMARVPKTAHFTHDRVESNVFLFDEPLKGSKSLKIFKISLTFLTSCDIYQNPLTQEKILKL